MSHEYRALCSCGFRSRWVDQRPIAEAELDIHEADGCNDLMAIVSRVNQ